MSENSPKSSTVNVFVNDLSLKRKYSEPKIYTGGVDIRQWSKLSKAEQKKALGKDWFVYYSFRNPATGKLQKMPFIKAGANSIKTKKERLQYLESVRQAVIIKLKAGANPITKTTDSDDDIKTVKESFKYVLSIKKAVLTSTSYLNFEGRINRFLKWLTDRGFEMRYITSVDFKTVNDYLNEVLQNSSAANRNNTRLDISALFGTMAKEQIIPENFVSKISVLKSTPTRNKSYTTTQESDIFDYMKANDPDLLLFVKFVSYNFLRPVEVSRLLVKDISITDARLQVQTKTAYKQKIIPKILLDELDLKGRNPDEPLFNVSGAKKERDRRGYYGQRFAKVKLHFGLGNDYGLYSFRHTFITKLYRELIKDKSPDEAESYLMSITGHSTRDALRKYLRSIDAYRPDDYSSMLK